MHWLTELISFKCLIMGRYWRFQMKFRWVLVQGLLTPLELGVFNETSPIKDRRHRAQQKLCHSSCFVYEPEHAMQILISLRKPLIYPQKSHGPVGQVLCWRTCWCGNYPRIQEYPQLEETHKDHQTNCSGKGERFCFFLGDSCGSWTRRKYKASRWWL